MARELTKLHPELARDLAPRLAEQIAQREALKGEVVIVIDAPGEEELAATTAGLRDGGAPFDLDAAIRAGLAAGTPKSALARELAARCDQGRSQVYDRIQLLARTLEEG